MSVDNKDLETIDISGCQSKALQSFNAAKHSFRFELAVPDPHASSETPGGTQSLARRSDQLHVS
jgi:hypothetical protein